MAVPICCVKEKVLGVLRLESERSLAFDEEDFEAFRALAEQLAHAIRRARVLEELHRKQADLRALSENLEEALEEDRRRIARELHDELAQAMSAARINLALLKNLGGAEGSEAQRAIGETGAIVEEMIAKTRRIAMDLRPALLDDLGLVPALRWLADTLSKRARIKVTVEARGAQARVHRKVETLLFRFVQEALTNVVRHAQARTVQVRIRRENGLLRAMVRDDGVGIRARGGSRRGLGLLGMRERIERHGGRLLIESGTGTGTRLDAEIPLLVGRPEKGDRMIREARS